MWAWVKRNWWSLLIIGLCLLFIGLAIWVDWWVAAAVGAASAGPLVSMVRRDEREALAARTLEDDVRREMVRVEAERRRIADEAIAKIPVEPTGKTWDDTDRMPPP